MQAIRNDAFMSSRPHFNTNCVNVRCEHQECSLNLHRNLHQKVKYVCAMKLDYTFKLRFIVLAVKTVRVLNRRLRSRLMK